jgi:uncharacterized membrane protein
MTMNLAPLISASPLIQAHAYTALAAVGVGLVQFALPKGVLPHRALGYFWAALMLSVAGTSLFISAHPVFGPFGPIHILSFFVLFNVPFAVWMARRGKTKTHARSMAWIYALALILTGLFTLWPGRIMNEVVFG